MGVMKIVYCCYRDWAKEIYKATKSTNSVLLETNQEIHLIHSIKPDLIFFLGWSWIVPKDIVNDYICICLHPSPLPKYRGGSPLQHQILNGEKISAVTLFRMDEGIDTGDIVNQMTFSLDGDLDDIFKRITACGISLIRDLLFCYPAYYKRYKQTGKSTTYKRRKPEESEITIEELKTKPAEYIYNKIRSLQNPYPNAFMVCGDGKKVYLTKGKI